MQFWVPMEKHHSWKKGWINLPNCLEISFFKRSNILCKVNYLARNLNWIERGYDVSYFFFISRLLKYCTTIFIPKIMWKIFGEYLIRFFVVSAIDANKSLKVLVVSYGLVIISPLSRKSTVGTLEATVFREIRDFIPFHVFLVLF